MIQNQCRAFELRRYVLTIFILQILYIYVGLREFCFCYRFAHLCRWMYSKTFSANWHNFICTYPPFSYEDSVVSHSRRCRLFGAWRHILALRNHRYLHITLLKIRFNVEPIFGSTVADTIRWTNIVPIFGSKIEP